MQSSHTPLAPEPTSHNTEPSSLKRAKGSVGGCECPKTKLEGTGEKRLLILQSLVCIRTCRSAPRSPLDEQEGLLKWSVSLLPAMAVQLGHSSMQGRAEARTDHHLATSDVAIRVILWSAVTVTHGAVTYKVLEGRYNGLGCKRMMFYTFSPFQGPLVSNWVPRHLSSTGNPSNFFLKGLEFFPPQIKKSIQRSHLPQTSLQGRQKFTHGRKMEKDSRNSLGNCRVREMSCPVANPWWKSTASTRSPKSREALRALQGHKNLKVNWGFLIISTSGNSPLLIAMLIPNKIWKQLPCYN